MPLETILTALEQKVPKGFALRTDKAPQTPGAGVTIADDFFEISF